MNDIQRPAIAAPHKKEKDCLAAKPTLPSKSPARPICETSILIVEDDEAIRIGTQMRIAQKGYRTITAIDGWEGWEMATELLPDLILMDIRMPRMDGLTALAKLKQNQRTMTIPVVIVSASPGDQNNALETGAEYFLRKPYAHEHLFEILSTALKQQEN